MKAQWSAIPFLAFILASCTSGTNEASKSTTVGTMVARDGCPGEGNRIIELQAGDRVQMYQSIVPVDPQSANLPPDSPLSKKLNLTYVKVMSGIHTGEYCWASTVNIEKDR